MPKDLTCQFQRWNLLLYIGGFKHLGAFCELWIHLRIWLAVRTWHRFLLKLNLANYSTTRRQLESLRVFPKIVQLCPKWYLNKCFYQSALSCNEKNANKPSLKSFVYLYKRGNLVTFAHTHGHFSETKGHFYLQFSWTFRYLQQASVFQLSFFRANYFSRTRLILQCWHLILLPISWWCNRWRTLRHF